MERDDLIVNDSYSLNAHHSEEEGVKIRKKILFVTVLLTVITAVEVAMGIIFKRAETFSWEIGCDGFKSPRRGRSALCYRLRQGECCQEETGRRGNPSFHAVPWIL